MKRWIFLALWVAMPMVGFAQSEEENQSEYNSADHLVVAPVERDPAGGAADAKSKNDELKVLPQLPEAIVKRDVRGSVEVYKIHFQERAETGHSRR